jgi:S-adenosylmethionine:tRNA ribosyltransferase-isomerase
MAMTNCDSRPQMRRSDFFYQLPQSLIAQRPPAVRSAGRMLHLGSDGSRADRLLVDLPRLLRPGDLMVFNNTRVIPARLRGRWPTGGRFELLIERLSAGERAIAQIRTRRSLRVGDRLPIDNGTATTGRSEAGRNGAVAEVVDRRGHFFELQFHGAGPVDELLQEFGEVPLPPYIRREAEPSDRERYQTVFARHEGAVAAPTAGLHFDEDLLARLREAGVDFAEITLHVGAGTFQPVRTEDIRDHVMHREWMRVDAEVCRKIEATRASGGRIVAVGTTVVRALESASISGSIAPFSGDTSLFITPGYRFRSVDVLLTNFHMPCSTLLMLVCAFAGTEPTLAAYRHAVDARYRFFSYGDAMLVCR